MAKIHPTALVDSKAALDDSVEAGAQVAIRIQAPLRYLEILHMHV